MTKVKFFIVSALVPFVSTNHTGIFVHLTQDWTDANTGDKYTKGLYFGGTSGWEYLTNDDAHIDDLIDAKIEDLDSEAEIATISGNTVTLKTKVIQTDGEIDDGGSEIEFADVAISGAALDVYYGGNSDYSDEPNNVEEALDDLYHKVKSIQSGSVTSFGNETGDITVGDGLKMTNKEVSVNLGTNNPYLEFESTDKNLQLKNVQSNTYTGATTTNLATVATVTAALDTLDVTGYAQGNIDTTNTSGQTTFTVKGIKEVDGKISDDTNSNTNLVIDGTYNASTNKIATQSTVTTAINNALDSEVTFKGVTATQPITPDNGDMWKASGAITIAAADAGEGAAFTTKAGDTIIYKYDSAQGATGNGWYLIPSADDVEDTWRDIKVNGSQLLGSGTSTGAVDFVSVQNNPVTVTGNGNAITIQHTTPSNFTATSDAAVKITTDNFGHITGTSALNAIDIPYAGESSVSGSEPATVEEALDDLYIKLNNTTANGLTGVTVGNQPLKITSHVADLQVGSGLQVTKDANDIVTIDAKVNSNDYIINDSTNGLSIDSSKVDSTYTVANTTNLATVATVNNAINGLDVTEFPLAEVSNNVVTIHGISEDNGKIAVGTSFDNDIVLEEVAYTGAAADVSIADSGNKFTATNVEDALAEIVDYAKGGVQSVTGETAISGGNSDYVAVSATEDTSDSEVHLTSTVKTQSVSTASQNVDGLATAYDVKTYVDGHQTTVVGDGGSVSVTDLTSSDGINDYKVELVWLTSLS